MRSWWRRFNPFSKKVEVLTILNIGQHVRSGGSLPQGVWVISNISIEAGPSGYSRLRVDLVDASYYLAEMRMPSE